MSVLQERVSEDLKEAMKKGDERGRDALRMLRAEFLREEIALMKKDQGLSDEEAQKIVSREIKKREEAALAFRNGKREESAQKEEAEAALLRAYLPPQMSDEDLNKIVEEAIAQSGAQTEKDMGIVMKEIMPKVAGKTDGTRVRKAVMEKLAAEQGV